MLIPRIGIIGTSSTGKTTLVEELVKKVKLNYIKENARSLLIQKQKDPTWKREDPINQLYFQYEIYKLKIYKELSNFNNGYIADRTFLDNFMYFMYYSHSIVNEQLCLQFEQINRVAMENYTHLFIMNIGSIPYKQDDIRTETYCASLFFETSLYGLIQRWKFTDKVIYIPYNDLKERIRFILSYIPEQYLKENN